MQPHGKRPPGGGGGLPAPTARFAPYAEPRPQTASPPPMMRRTKTLSPTRTPAPGASLPAPAPAAALTTPLTLPKHPLQVCELPFTTRNRSPAEVHYRRSQRPLLQHLVRQTCHWVDAPEGANIDRPPFDCVLKGEISVPQAPVPVGWEQPDITHIYALLATGIHPGASQHVLRRIDVIARTSDGGATVEAFGGAADNASLEVHMAHLSLLVKEQADITVTEWLPLVEFEYRNNARTIFFVPVGLQGTCVLPRSTRMGDAGPAYTPVITKLVDLLDYRLSAEDVANSRAMTELVLAADAYDEFLMRDATAKILSLLREHMPQMQAISDETLRRRELVDAEKCRRENAKVQREVDRVEEHARLRQQWKHEDLGKTDRQKRSLLAARQQMLQDVEAAFHKAEAEAAREPAVTEAAKEKGRRVWIAEDDSRLMLFQYFDRPMSTLCGTETISRNRLADFILCLNRPELQSRAQVNDVLTSSLPIGTRIPYPQFCTSIIPVLDDSTPLHGESCPA